VVTETELVLGDGRTLHVYDTGAGDGAARLAAFWHHGTPNTGAPPEPLFAAAAERGIRWVSQGARLLRLVDGVEGDACLGRIGMSSVHTSLSGDGQADYQRGCGDAQNRRDPKAYMPGHRDLLHSMRLGSLVVRSHGDSGWESHRRSGRFEL
jgi:hypothetical protein